MVVEKPAVPNRRKVVAKKPEPAPRVTQREPIAPSPRVTQRQPGTPPRATQRQPPVPGPAASAGSGVPNEPTTSVASKTDQAVIDTLAGVSVLRPADINRAQATRLSDIFNGMPGVWFSERGDDPATAINIRGLQDFGRVAVLVDGAQQNFQRSGHFANGLFYLDPEFVGGVDVVRGPVANIYGSGAIGGVASFRTKELDDILLPGEMAAVQSRAQFSSNGSQWLDSTFGGARGPNGDVFIGGVFRSNGNYTEGAGTQTSLQCVASCAGYPTTTLLSNAVVPYTWNETESGMVKVTGRPGDGQQIKFSAVTYNSNYDFGQTNGFGTTIPGIGVFSENIKNQTVTGEYTLKAPETPLIDFKSNVYWNQTIAIETVKIPYLTGCGPGCVLDVSGPPGSVSSFMLNTAGFNANNTSRFETWGLRHTVTYGGDFNRDTLDIGTMCAADQLVAGACNISLTPDGHRATYGGFVEWNTKYSNWLEVINAVRYDGFALVGSGGNETGQRYNPKSTIGITPIQGITPYVTYAEGYRAPAVTEAFISGFHPGGFLYFEPNPHLQPEVGKTEEVGVNIKYDNVIAQGDKVRIKVDAFRNYVVDYIDQVQAVFTFAPPQPPCVPTPFGYSACYQYQNIGNVRIQGLEFEANYDAGLWFAGVSGQHIRGKSITANPTVEALCVTAPTSVGCPGAPLASIPPDQVSILLGARFLDRKLNLSMRWTAIAAKPLSDIPTIVSDSGATVPIFDSARSYNLVSFYAGYQATPDVLATFSVENLLNENYAKYMCCSTSAGYVVPNPGITFKGSLTAHLGVAGG